MTVAELIERLRGEDPTAIVVATYNDDDKFEATDIQRFAAVRRLSVGVVVETAPGTPNSVPAIEIV